MKLRVLIADDEQLERRALYGILSSLEGYELELLEAVNGRQALMLAEAAPVDLAFLDIRMPGLDGLQAAHELRKLCPDIHIVFVTAFDHFDYAREAIRLGVDEYLVKPAPAEEVLRTAARIIARIEEKMLRGEAPRVQPATGGLHATGVETARHGSGTVERALEYMQAHLAENISLADVAAAVGSAPSHLSRLFSRQSGDTFVHVFCRLRISAAKDLLRGGQYRVKEVCFMVGFNDQAYFSRVFRKYEGVSPVDYRGG